MVSLLSLMEGLSLVIKQLPQKALPALSPVAQLVPPNSLRVWLGPCCVLMDPRTSPWRLDNTDSPSSEVVMQTEATVPFLASLLLGKRPCAV